MKLLYLMTEPFGIGGVQSDLLTLGRDLARKGHVVYVATTPGVLLDELTSRGVRHVDIDFHVKGPVAFWRACKRLRDLVTRERIEMIAPQSVRSAMIAKFALRLLSWRWRRLPIVVTIHNIHTPLHFRYAGRILRHCADFVIFESNYERTRVTASGLPQHRSVVVHSGIDIERFAAASPVSQLLERYRLDPSRHLVFGIVARLSEEKGHRYLIDAFARVVSNLPHARLMIVGDGPLRDSIVEQVNLLKLHGQVILAGAQRDIPSYLQLLDVFVLASTRESFPLAAREAMAAGKAVIAPRIGGCGEVVDDGVTGLLVEPASAEALAKAMLAIARDDNYRKFGVAGQARARRLFSCESWVDGDERLYLQYLRPLQHQ